MFLLRWLEVGFLGHTPFKKRWVGARAGPTPLREPKRCHVARAGPYAGAAPGGVSGIGPRGNGGGPAAVRGRDGALPRTRGAGRAPLPVHGAQGGRAVEGDVQEGRARGTCPRGPGG